MQHRRTDDAKRPRGPDGEHPEGTSRSGFEMRTARDVGRLLWSLGASRSSVAASLEMVGVRAASRDPFGSPVDRYLHAVVGADPNVKSVRIEAGVVVVRLQGWWRSVVTVPLPTVVQEFASAFDAGCYPALLQRQTRGQG